MRELTDPEIRELLLAIDESDDIDVTTWEAHFIETVAYKWQGSWTPKVRQMVMQIVEKYQESL